MPATLLARLSPDLGMGAGFRHPLPLHLLEGTPRRALAVARPAPVPAPALPWADRLAAWADARPVHHRLGSWMLIGR